MSVFLFNVKFSHKTHLHCGRSESSSDCCRLLLAEQLRHRLHSSDFTNNQTIFYWITSKSLVCGNALGSLNLFCDNTSPEGSVMSGLTQNEMNGPAPARPSLCSKMIQPRGPSSQCQSVTPPLGPHLSNLFRNQRTKLRELRTSRISAVRELLDITNEYLTSTSFISKVNQRVGRPYIYL